MHFFVLLVHSFRFPSDLSISQRQTVDRCKAVPRPIFLNSSKQSKKKLNTYIRTTGAVKRHLRTAQ